MDLYHQAINKVSHEPLNPSSDLKANRGIGLRFRTPHTNTHTHHSQKKKLIEESQNSKIHFIHTNTKAHFKRKEKKILMYLAE